MTSTRTFTTAAVVSAVTGRLICELDDCINVLSYMIGRPLWTHELSDAIREVRRHGVVPEWLTTLTDDGVDRTNWQAWRDGIVAEHGPTVTLSPMTYSALREASAFETAVRQFGKDRVIEVDGCPLY